VRQKALDIAFRKGCCGHSFDVGAKRLRRRSKRGSCTRLQHCGAACGGYETWVLLGRKACVEILLWHGADLNLPLRCEDYGTVLIAAACNSRSSGAEDSALGVLVEHGAEINARPRIGKYGSALVAAAFVGELDYVKHLVAHGADVNAVLDVGKFGSALAAAASRHKSHFHAAQSVVLFWLEHGADINAVLPIGTFGSALGAVLARGRDGSSDLKRILLSLGWPATQNKQQTTGI